MVSSCPDVRDTHQYGFSETARILDLSRPKLYQLVKDGFLKTHRYNDNHRQYCLGVDIIRCYRSIVLCRIAKLGRPRKVL